MNFIIFNVGPQSTTLAQHQIRINDSMYRVCWDNIIHDRTLTVYDGFGYVTQTCFKASMNSHLVIVLYSMWLHTGHLRLEHVKTFHLNITQWFCFSPVDLHVISLSGGGDVRHNMIKLVYVSCRNVSCHKRHFKINRKLPLSNKL